MPICPKCGEPEDIRWNSYHGACEDCVGVYDMDRHREKAHYCRFCKDWASTVMFNSRLQCKACGGGVEVRFKT